MTLEEQIMKLQTYKMFEGEDTVYVERDGVLKLLEQEPCEDAINREDALMALTGEWTEITDEIIHRFIKRIKMLPPVTPQPKIGLWIPVSERFPLLRGSFKISDDVLITNGYETDMGYLIERKGKIFWHYYGSEYEVGIKDEDNDATAWMPLPEPYKAESEYEG